MAERDQVERDKDKQLDAMLDGLLSTYSAVDPRPGLETRILANVRETAAKKRTGFWSNIWLWAGVAAATAVAVILLAVYFSRPDEHRPQRAVVNPPEPQVIAPDQTRHESASKIPERAPSRHSLSTRVAVNRLDVFPSPVPLSEQEKFLLRYLRATPREELVAQSHPDEQPAEVQPQDQSALPARGFTNQPSNTR